MSSSTIRRRLARLEAKGPPPPLPPVAGDGEGDGTDWTAVLDALLALARVEDGAGELLEGPTRAAFEELRYMAPSVPVLIESFESQARHHLELAERQAEQAKGPSAVNGLHYRPH